ncbi:MAG: CRISPR-associated protein Cas4 [Acidilobaceae archaeon]
MNLKKPVITPSEVRTYTYCPRLYFFEVHVKLGKPLKSKIRMLLGRILHYFREIIARLRGFTVEELIEVDIGPYIMRGKPDYYRVEDGEVFIVEVKSSRGPHTGAWFSDYMQGVAYGFILSRVRRNIREVNVEIKYMRSTARIKVNSEHIALLARILDEINIIKVHGILPYPNRSQAKCNRCIYRDICFKLDEYLEVNIEEPGSWIRDYIHIKS